MWAVGEGEAKLPLWMTASYKGPLREVLLLAAWLSEGTEHHQLKT